MALDRDGLLLWKWNFRNDGSYGHIYFLIKKGQIEHASDNGAYCRNLTDAELLELWDDDFKQYDCVHVATPCMEDGDDLECMRLDVIIDRAIDFINSDLR